MEHAYQTSGYGSDPESVGGTASAERGHARAALVKPVSVAHKAHFSEALSEAAKRDYALRHGGLNAHQRHQMLLRDYARYYQPSSSSASSAAPGSASSQGDHAEGAAFASLNERRARMDLSQDYLRPYPGISPSEQAAQRALRERRERTDADVVRETYRFVRTQEHDRQLSAEDEYAARVAQRYYDRLHREYALVDLSRARAHAQVGLRWRTEGELLAGKGQFTCGEQSCRFVAAEQGSSAAELPSEEAPPGLDTFRLPFSYREHGELCRVHVKVRLCAHCAELLRFATPSAREDALRSERAARKEAKRKRRRHGSTSAEAEQVHADKKQKKKQKKKQPRNSSERKSKSKRRRKTRRSQSERSQSSDPAEEQEQRSQHRHRASKRNQQSPAPSRELASPEPEPESEPGPESEPIVEHGPAIPPEMLVERHLVKLAEENAARAPARPSSRFSSTSTYMPHLSLFSPPRSCTLPPTTTVTAPSPHASPCPPSSSAAPTHSQRRSYSSGWDQRSAPSSERRSRAGGR
mmetsp:Transcript_44609/g.112402  ORF Transcript_44609/g.112402 Transcript_44609/m.112402 type:complete len:524 (+) Transcript_44609:64-1635(+)